MHYTYEPDGVCSTRIDIELDVNIVRSVQFEDGCNGNLTAISRLVAGLTIEQVLEKFTGIMCDDRPTSCADQLSKAIREANEVENGAQTTITE